MFTIFYFELGLHIHHLHNLRSHGNFEHQEYQEECRPKLKPTLGYTKCLLLILSWSRITNTKTGKSPMALCKCRSTQPSLHLWCSPGSGLVPSSGQYIFLFFLSTYTPYRPPTLTYTGKAPKYAQMGPIADDSSSWSESSEIHIGCLWFIHLSPWRLHLHHQTFRHCFRETSPTSNTLI